MQSHFQTVGDELFSAERSQMPVAPPTERFPEMTLEDAYQIQSSYEQRRLADGAKVVGWKVGATSKATQELFGASFPGLGRLFDDMEVADGGVVVSAGLIQPKIEGELAFVLKSSLAGPDVTVSDVIEAIGEIVPCFEIVDSRVEDWRIKLTDSVADNGSSARFVLGSSPASSRFDLPAVEMNLFRNGEVVATGVGSTVLGDPAASVAWLANKLSEFDLRLESGTIVLSGSLAAAFPVSAGDRYEATFTGIGKVSCRFE